MTSDIKSNIGVVALWVKACMKTRRFPSRLDLTFLKTALRLNHDLRRYLLHDT